MPLWWLFGELKVLGRILKNFSDVNNLQRQTTILPLLVERHKNKH